VIRLSKAKYGEQLYGQTKYGTDYTYDESDTWTGSTTEASLGDMRLSTFRFPPIFVYGYILSKFGSKVLSTKSIKIKQLLRNLEISRLILKFYLKTIVSGFIMYGYFIKSKVLNNFTSMKKILAQRIRTLLKVYSNRMFITRTLSIVSSIKFLILKGVRIMFTLLKRTIKIFEINFILRLLTFRNQKSLYNSRLFKFGELNIPHRIITIISKGFGYSYSIRSLLQKSLSILYEIKSVISKLLSVKHSLRSLVSPIIIEKYSLITIKFRTLGIFSSLRNLKVGVLSVLYGTKALVSDFTSLIFSIRSFIENLFTTLYNILTITLVSKLLFFKFSIKQLKIKTLNSVHKLLSLRNRIIISIYSLKHTISKTFRSIFSIIGRLSRYLKVSYAVGLFTTRVLQISHSMIGQIFSSIKILQSILISSINLFSLKFGVRDLKEKILTSINNLSGLVIKEFRILYNVIFKQIISSSLRIFHSIQVLMNRSVISSFKISQILQRTISMLYKIPGLVTRELISSFKNLVTKIKILRFKFKLKKNVEVIISILHSSIGIVSNILKISYEVISGIYEILVSLVRIKPDITLIKEKTIQILKKIIRRVKK